jgi:hypothetical protein
MDRSSLESTGHASFRSVVATSDVARDSGGGASVRLHRYSARVIRPSTLTVLTVHLHQVLGVNNIQEPPTIGRRLAPPVQAAAVLVRVADGMPVDAEDVASGGWLGSGRRDSRKRARALVADPMQAWIG